MRFNFPLSWVTENWGNILRRDGDDDISGLVAVRAHRLAARSTEPNVHVRCRALAGGDRRLCRRRHVLTEAIKNGPRVGKHYLARAEAYVRLKRWPEALADYDRAEQLGLASRVDNYFVHAGRGYVVLVSHDYPFAIARLDEALAIDHDAVNVLMWRGYAYERRGQFEAALRLRTGGEVSAGERIGARDQRAHAHRGAGIAATGRAASSGVKRAMQGPRD